jgi:predicted membrane channel-forming protein YqfA (hemolysin III family)
MTNSDPTASPQEEAVDVAIGKGLRVATHVITGAMFGFIAYFSVMSRSLALAVSMLIFMAFFTVPAVASLLRKSQLKPLRWLGVAALAGWVGTILYYMALTADHLYMVNGNTYPKWLAETVRVQPDKVLTIGGSDSLCAGYGMGDFFRKENGMFLRCGVMGGSQKTYFIENFDEAYSAYEAAQEARK